MAASPGLPYARQRFSWHNYAFLRLVLCFALGIAAGNSLSLWPLATWLCLAAGAFLVGVGMLAFALKRPDKSSRLAASAGLIVLLATAGAARMQSYRPEAQSDLGAALQTPGSSGWISEYHQYGARYSAVVVLDRLTGRGIQPLRVWVSGRSDTLLPLRYGYRVVLGNRLWPLGTQSFDQYLYSRQIFLKVNVPASQLRVQPAEEGWTILAHADGLARAIRARVYRVMQSPLAAAVTDGLITGNQDSIDRSVQRAFQATGTAHIMAVSGTHILLMASILGLVFRRWQRHKRWWVRAPVLLLFATVLWGYGFMTGFAPPVVRALVMYTLVLVATGLSRPQTGLNFLGLAALVQLWVQPTLLFNAGFSLSASATLGILLLSPVLDELVHTLPRRLRPIGLASGITLIATLFITPVSLYFFGTMPVYFLPANLVVGIASNLCLYAGLAACGLLSLAEALGWQPLLQALDTVFRWGILDWPALLMVHTAQFFAELPLAELPWKASVVEVILGYAFIATMLAAWQLHSRRWLWASAYLVALGAISSAWAPRPEMAFSGLQPVAIDGGALAKTWFGAAGIWQGQRVVYLRHGYSLRRMPTFTTDYLVVDAMPDYSLKYLSRATARQILYLHGNGSQPSASVANRQEPIVQALRQAGILTSPTLASD